MWHAEYWDQTAPAVQTINRGLGLQIQRMQDGIDGWRVQCLDARATIETQAREIARLSHICKQRMEIIAELRAAGGAKSLENASTSELLGALLKRLPAAEKGK
jgi:hypothetical protein